MNKPSKYVSLLTVFAFLIQQIPFLIAADAPPSEKVKSIEIPTRLGHVLESDLKHNNPIIFYLQDVHVHQEAQNHIAEIIEHINRQWDIDLICVEGSQGAFELDLYSTFPDQEVKSSIGQLLLDEGYLTGVEKTVFELKDPPPIYGIETPELYLKNREHLIQVYKNKSFMDPFLSTSKNTLENMELLNASLAQLNMKHELYQQGKMDFEKFLAYLTQLDGNAIQKYAHLTGYQKFQTLGDDINDEQLQLELRRLVNELTSKLAKDDLKQFIKDTLLYRQGKINQVLYFRYIESLRQKAGVIIRGETYQKYLSYLKTRGELYLPALTREMNALYKEMLHKLIQNRKEETWLNLREDLQLLEKLFALELTPDEYRKINDKSLDLYRFKEGVEDLSQKTLNLPEISEEIVAEALGFYELVIERDYALIENALDEIKKRDAKVIIMITGGFHQQGIREVLKENEYRYAIIAPSVKELGDHDVYLQRVLGAPLEFDAFAQTLVSHMSPTLEMNPITADALGSRSRLERFQALVSTLFQTLGINVF